ncbi:MAG: T9SS type A sorting domain-containing protein [Bacteroidetes bacterium]|nr:MAG: T9SS type A sorting domain-containing protein [Bacteroidota bacterium]
MKKILLQFIALSSSVSALAQVTLTPIGSYHTGVFDASATEIMAWNAADERVYSTNASAVSIDAIDLSDPTNPVLDFSIDLSNYGSGVNSVAYFNGYVVAAVDANDPQADGSAVFFDADGNFVAQVTVGAMPDMITVAPDGTKVLTANEGEPNDDYTVDPLGSVSIIDVSGGVANLQQSNVTTLDFTAFNAPAPIDPNIRIFGPNASVAQDLEPEYITITHDSQLALVVCQENNAIAGIDLNTNTILAIQSLGFKDYNAAGNGIDASNQDGAINIQNWPVFGMYQPDAIDNYMFNGSTYIVTANEGDSRDYAGFSEEARIGSLTLDATVFPDAATLQSNANLGRLNVTTTLGDDGNDNDFEALYSYGARSFSIWDLSGNLVYDSGDDFETFISTYDAANFNSNNDDNTSFDSRSDDKGPEPEALKVVSMMDKTYAFIGLERQGGVMVYDITDPSNVSFESYGTDRDFTQPEGTPAAGGLGPEDIDFIPANESPTGFPLLLVSNEVSGSISVYSVSGLPDASPLVITEIMYNSPEANTDSLEFVEIYNPTPSSVDLSGYFFRQGFDFVFPQGAEVGAGEFVMVAIDSVIFENWYGTTAYQWQGGDALNNGGEDIVLAAPSGAVADSVDYDDAGAWPTEADGDGYSLVLCDPFSDNNDGSNWSLASVSAGFSVQTAPPTEVFADPGASNCFTVGIDEQIITTAMKLYPNPNTGDFFLELTGVTEATMIQVYNATGRLVNEFNVNATGQVAVSQQLDAGVYHVVMSSNSNRRSLKMVVLK